MRDTLADSMAPDASPRLYMVRDTLDNIPDFPLVPGYFIRSYEPGDEAHWLNIHLQADHHNRITSELFAQQFGAEAKLLRDRQFYLIHHAGQPIGTGTAWYGRFEAQIMGRVHWLAILPEYQGRGLSKPLMAAICRRLRELGHSRAYLATSAARRPAIELYLRFGFVPWPRDIPNATQGPTRTL